MPFIESATSAKAKAHASDMGVPALLFVLVVAGAGVLLMGTNAFGFVQAGSFALEGAASQEPAGNTGGGLGAGEAGEETPSPQEPAVVTVFVSGCVASPGVYELAKGSRVNDAIRAAGGFAGAAATDALNLARVLSDGEQIHIPSAEDLENGTPSPAGASGADVGQAGVHAAGGLLNVNTATQAQLEELPGIGPATAAKIVESRTREGPFASTRDLLRVSGIGEKKLSAIEGLVCV